MRAVDTSSKLFVMMCLFPLSRGTQNLLADTIIIAEGERVITCKQVYTTGL